MKKLVLLFAAAFCLPVLGLTGCGGGGENTVIETTTDDAMSEAEQADMDAGMDAAMGDPQE